MTEGKVTPWDVSGTIDYNKLIREFGVEYISAEQKQYLLELAKAKGLQEHIFLRRGLFFAQMDLSEVISAHKAGQSIFLYTGRAPGGSMHLGHLIPFLFTKFLQDLFDCNLYIQFPDDEKFLFKKDLTQSKVDDMCQSDLLDVASFGFNIEKTFIFRNSEFIAHMYPLVLEVSKRLTFSQARNTFGFTNDSNVGMIHYPALQITPTFFERGFCLIPCGIDQNPYFLLQRDFAVKMGFHKNATILSKFLPSLTGPAGKMSASDPSKALLLSDDAATIKKKINKYAYSGGRETLEEHRKLGGNTEIDVSFQWLYYLFEEDDMVIEQIKKNYESGSMLSGEMKALFIDKVNAFFSDFQARRVQCRETNLLRTYMYEGTLAKAMWERTGH